MLATGAPEVLWDYCLEWCALVRSHTALNVAELDGQVPTTKMTGDTSNISFIAEFGWYDWVLFVSPDYEKNRMGVKQLDCHLGPAANVGDAMCGTVITSKSTRLDRTSIITLTLEDHNNESIIAQKKEFTEGQSGGDESW